MLFSNIYSRWSQSLIATIIGKVMFFPCEKWGEGRGVFIFVIMAEEVGASKGWGGDAYYPKQG